MKLLVFVAIFSLFIVPLAQANHRPQHDFCQERLTLSPIQVGSTLIELISAEGVTRPISPPICLQAGQLMKFFGEFQQVLQQTYPDLIDFYAIHDGNPEQGYQIEFRTTFFRPRNSQIPGAVRWIPAGTTDHPNPELGTPIKTPWRGNCYQGLPPLEGIQEEIFGPDADDPVLDPDFRPSADFFAYRTVLPINSYSVPPTEEGERK